MSMFALLCRVLWNDREKYVFWHLRWQLLAVGLAVWGVRILLGDRNLATIIFG